MSTEEAIKLLACFMITIFLLRPLAGLLVDAFKVMLRLALAGLVLQIIPLDFIDEWSKASAGWANVSATFVPVIALMFLIGMSTANLVFLTGTKVEEVAKVVLYVIGGVFTAGSAEWIAFERSVGLVVAGILGILVGVFNILKAIVPTLPGGAPTP